MVTKQVTKWILYTCFLLLTFLVQTTILSGIKVMGVHASLMPVAVAIVAVFEGTGGGAVFGLAAGLICDALIPPGEAFFTVYLLFAGMIIGKLCNVYFKKRLLTAFLWSLAALALENLLYFIIFYLIAGRAGTEALYAVALPETAFSLLFVPIVYLPALGVYRRFGENNQ